MTRLHINIKDSDKAIIVINLLKELPFVEIESSVMDFDGKPTDKNGKGLEDLFGLNDHISFWESSDIDMVGKIGQSSACFPEDDEDYSNFNLLLKHKP